MENNLSSTLPIDKFAHDLRHSLRAIMFSAQRMQRQNPPLPAEALALLADLTSAVRRQDELIGSAVDYHWATHEGADSEKVMRLATIIHAACQSVEPLRKSQNGTIQFDDCPAVYAPAKLAKALGKLLHNALKFQLAGTAAVVKVEVTEVEREGITVRITDNGIGVEEKYRESLFSPLARLHGPNEYPGPGLGLSIARSLLASINGTVLLESSGGPTGVSAVVRWPTSNGE